MTATKTRPVQATAPKRIYLQGGPQLPENIDFSALSEVTWCRDDVDGTGIPYVRADLAGAAPAAVAGPTWQAAADWLRDNYQDHPNIASLCDALVAAAPALEAPAAPAVDALRALMSLVRREAPHLSGKVMGEADAILASAALAAAIQTPSAPGMAVTALVGEIVAALEADEKDGGYDLTAGMFGPKFSSLVRRWAASEWALVAAPQAPAAPSGVVGWVKDECTGPGAFDPMFVRGAAPLPAGYVANYRPVVYAAAPAAPAGEPYAYEIHAPDEPALGSILIYKKDHRSYIGDGWVVKHTLRADTAAPAAPAVDAPITVEAFGRAVRMALREQLERKPPRYLNSDQAAADASDHAADLQECYAAAIAAQAKEGGEAC